MTALPPRQEVQSTLTPLPGTVLPPREAACSPLKPPARESPFQAGNNPPQVRQTVKLQLGQAGKLPGIQSGIGPPGPPRGTALPPRQTALVPGKATQQLTPQ